MSEPAVDAATIETKILNRALDTIGTVPAALTELGGKIDASRQASADAHIAHGAKLDKFADVIAANTTAMTSTATANASLATELQAIRERNAAIASEVANATNLAAVAKAKAGASTWAAVDKWLPRIVALLAAAYAAYKGMEPTPGTTTTTATTTITAPADGTP